MYETTYQNPVSRKDQALRNLFGSPKVLCMAIFGFVSVVLSVIAVPATISSFFNSILSSIPFNTFLPGQPSFDGLNAALSSITSGLVVIAIIASIPAILTAVAYLLFYINSKNPNKGFKVPATILQVLAVIGFVSTCVLTAIVMIILIIALAGVSAYDPTNMGSSMIGAAIFIYAIILGILLFVTYIPMRFTISLKKSSTTSEITRKGSIAYSVIIMFNLVVTAFSVLGNATTLLTGFATSLALVSVLSQGINIANYLMNFMFVLGFNKIIKEEEYAKTFGNSVNQNPYTQNPYNQTPYPQAPVANETYYNQPEYNQPTATNNAYENQQAYYNNPYTTQQEIPQPVEQPVSNFGGDPSWYTENQNASADNYQNDTVVLSQYICKQCGHVVNPTDSFCMNCGSAVER